jgi:hypothetical protein
MTDLHWVLCRSEHSQGRPLPDAEVIDLPLGRTRIVEQESETLDIRETVLGPSHEGSEESSRMNSMAGITTVANWLRFHQQASVEQ